MKRADSNRFRIRLSRHRHLSTRNEVLPMSPERSREGWPFDFAPIRLRSLRLRSGHSPWLRPAMSESFGAAQDRPKASRMAVRQGFEPWIQVLARITV